MADAPALPIPASEQFSGPSSLGRLAGFVRTLARQKPLGFASLVVITLMLVFAAVPQLFATHDPGDQNADAYQPNCLGPSGSFLCRGTVEEGITVGGVQVTEGKSISADLSHPLGTDRLGRDTYSRIVHGTRIVVQVGFLATALSALIALTIGVSSAYFGGWYDSVLQRAVDSVMAFPPLVVLLALPSVVGGPTWWKLAIILGFLGGFGGSRVMRSATLGLRSAQFVDAARTIGSTDLRIMVRHLLPNLFGPLMVQATIGLGGTILAEAALSFLGLGLADNNTPTWGYMLNLAQSVAVEHPWQAFWPGLAIAVVVFSFNMLGDALRDLLDPRLRGAGGGFK